VEYNYFLLSHIRGIYERTVMVKKMYTEILTDLQNFNTPRKGCFWNDVSMYVSSSKS
jgi:hypothetical protein